MANCINSNSNHKQKEHTIYPPIIFECNNGYGTIISQTTPNTPFTPIGLGNITIDTSCLINPKIKFDFTSVISYIPNGAEGDILLTFQLSKYCNDDAPVPIGTWDFKSILDISDERFTSSFCFSACECSACSDCCTYIVELVRVIKEDANDVLSINNITLSVIAKSSC